MFAKHDRAIACLGWEARLEDYVEGRLAPAEAGQVEAHARSCTRCAEALDRAKVSVALLAPVRARPLPQAGPFFVSRVMAGIRGERSEEELWKPLEVAGWELCWLATAAALILAFVMLRIQITGPQLPATTTAQQSQIQELINVPIAQPAVRDDALLVAYSSNDNGR
jgi:anti-sigma factor RsiW